MAALHICLDWGSTTTRARFKLSESSTIYGHQDLKGNFPTRMRFLQLSSRLVHNVVTGDLRLDCDMAETGQDFCDTFK
eukprot:40200-Eustigmatos_ZCMA.PRE.1